LPASSEQGRKRRQRITPARAFFLFFHEFKQKGGEKWGEVV
jgi:hypothetical protein